MHVLKKLLIMASGRDLVREWLFEYACRHHMPSALHEIALHHNSIWTEELWSIPPIFPMMAVVHSVVVSEDEEKYSFVLDIIAELYERTTSFVDYGIYVKLSIALKILVLFRMLRNSDKMVLPRLNAYFPRSGFHYPNADKNIENHMNQSQLDFRKCFLRLIANESVRKAYMEREFGNEYGDVFMLRLKELVRRFLTAIETSLPQPVVDKILTSPPDSALIQELVSSHSTSVEILLDAAVGRNLLTEGEVLEILKNLRQGNTSLPMDGFVGLAINLLMSPATIQESESMLKNENASKTENTGKRIRKRKAEEKFEDENEFDSCAVETGKRGHASNFIQPRKKARISSGDNDLVEEDESSSASVVQKGSVAGLQDTVQTCTGVKLIESRDSINNRCLKSTKPRNNNEDIGDNRCSKRTRDKNSRRLSKSKEPPNCGHINGIVNFGAKNSASCCPTGPSSSAMLIEFHRSPAIQQCPVAVDLCSRPSRTSAGICNRAIGVGHKQSSPGCSNRSRADGSVEIEDVELTEESKGGSNDNCSSPSFEYRREEVRSSGSPLREDAVPDTSLHERGISRSSYMVTVEEEEEGTDDETYVTDSEDFQSYTTAQEEIVPSSYSFDKFDLVVRDILPTVSLPLLEQHVHSSLRACVIKLHKNSNLIYTTVDGNKISIFR